MGDFIPPSASQSKKERCVNILVTGFGPFRATKINPSWEVAKLLSKRSIILPDPKKSVALDIAYIPVEYDFIVEALAHFHGEKDNMPELPPDMAQDSDIQARNEFRPNRRYDLILHIGQGRVGGMQIETVAHQLGYRLLDARQALAPIADGDQFTSDEDANVPEQYMSIQERNAGMNRGYPIPQGFEAHLGDESQLVNRLDTQRLADDLSVRFPDITIKKSTNAGRYLCEFIYFGSLSGSLMAQDRAKRDGSDVTRTEALFVHVPPEDMPLSIEQMTNVVQQLVQDVAIGLKGGRPE